MKVVQGITIPAILTQVNFSKSWAKFFALILLSMLIIPFAQANSQPKFALLPTTATTLELGTKDSALVQYRLSNQTKITRSLVMLPIRGINQRTNGSGFCSSPVILASQQSCLLSLHVDGSTLPKNGVHGGPVVCKTKGSGDNSPDPYLCSQPSASNSLNIIKSGIGHLAFLQNGVALKVLNLRPGDSGVISLVNQGNATITNLKISLPFVWLAYFSNSCSTTLAANSRCNISYFIPSPSAIGTNPLSVTGENVDNSPLAISVNIRLSGALKCWGANSSGQLGIGNTTDQSTAVAVIGLGNSVTAVTGGYAHTCALETNGKMSCWGDNSYGQLGDGTATDSNIPVAVASLGAAVIAISNGQNHSCALLNSGLVKCWGDNTFGQLGDGTVIERNTPATVAGLSAVIAISGGDYHSCALVTSGQMKCWGDNAFGQLGDGTTDERHTPIAVLGLTKLLAISGGGFHSCALASSGEMKCWGLNSCGQVGDGTYIDKSTAVKVVGLNTVIAITTGTCHSCALLKTGQMKCWGDNAFGQLGNGDTVEVNTPVTVLGLSDVLALSGGYGHTCALDQTGQMSCWGLNAFGQLGDGTTDDHTTAVAVSGLGNSSLAIFNHNLGNSSCALTQP